jgi:hypothetical protein
MKQKVIIKTKDLLPAVHSLLTIAGGRTTIPILSHLRIEAKNGKLIIAASDIEQYCEWQIDCEGTLEPCCLYARHFAPLVEAAGPEVKLERGTNVIAVTGNGEANLPFMEAEEFVRRPEDKLTPVAVECVELADSIDTVAWVTALSDRGRLICEFAYIVIAPKKLSVRATNGRILSNVEKDLIGGDYKFACHQNFHRNIVQWLRFKDSQFMSSHRSVSVKSECGQWWGNLSEGVFELTGFNDIIAKGGATKIGGISMKEIKPALELAALFKNPGNNPINVNPVTLEFAKDGLDIFLKGYHKRIEGKFVPYTCKADIGYMLNIINHLESDEIQISHGDPGSCRMLSLTDQKTQIFLAQIHQI